MALNKSCPDYYAQFQKLIADYNAGALNDDAFFAQLLSLTQGLTYEEQRHIDSYAGPIRSVSRTAA